MLECLECKKWFWTRDKHVGRRRYCSWECRRIGYPKDHGSPLTPEERHQAKIQHDREYRKKNRKKINRSMRRKRKRRTPEQREQERRRRRRYYEEWKAKQPPKRYKTKEERKPYTLSPEGLKVRQELAKENGRRRRAKNAHKKHVEKMRRMTAMAAKNQLTPRQAGALRAQVYKFVQDHLLEANEVVLGTKEWSPTQARVFGMLLNKVIPDVNASFVQHEHSTKSLRELSREELEAIAQGESEINVEGEVIEHDSQES